MTRRSSSRIRVGAYASPAMNGVLLATAAIGLAGCDDGVQVPKDEAGYVSQLGADEPIAQAAAFSTVKDCMLSGDYTEQQCKDAKANADRQSLQFAPRYQSAADCQTDYGQCQQQLLPGGGGSFFTPFVTGFIVSELIDEMGDAFEHRRHRYAPLYRTRDGSYVNGSGYGVPKLGTYPVGRSGYEGLTTPPRTVTRRGLGQTYAKTGGVPGSKTTVAKLSGSTSGKAISTAAWGSTKSASWSSKTSASAGGSYGVTRGGFGSSSRGGGIGGGRSGG